MPTTRDLLPFTACDKLFEEIENLLTEEPVFKSQIRMVISGLEINPQTGRPKVRRSGRAPDASKLSN